ncbi:MAG: phosphatidylinositol-specific phospholipase C/glycerophosphodiester phosphodiesterase family protein [Bacteroidota bacterium]
MILKMRQAIFKQQLLKTVLFVLMLSRHLAASCQSTPLPNAFAHNDYSHKRPLFDALDNGYTNIEADIFLKDNDFVVAHINPFFKQGQGRTLELLYLQPLMKLITKNQGQVYRGYNSPVTLLVDIKTDAEATYRALKPLLEKYRSILTRYEDGKVYPKQVTIVLSGNKPFKSITAETRRLAFIDEDLKSNNRDTSSTNVYAMASCKYSRLLRWNGEGAMPIGEKQLLLSYVTAAHKYGKRVRLWASPENLMVWQELLNCGVDLINTDKLAMLKNFLLSGGVLYAKAN